MATTYTANYNLGKQEDHADKFSMKVLTDNMDIIDAAMGAIEDEVTEARGTYDSLDERLDATEVPEVGADDDGKVLKATYSEGVGTYTWEDEGGGTTDYTDLSNKPSINNVTLSGNKTASDLGIGEVPEVGVNDDGKVLKASYTGGVGTYSWQTGGGGGGSTSDYSDLDNKPQINSITLSGNKTSSDLGLQSEIDSSHKLSADLIDDTSATNKFVTASDKNMWNGKQDALTFDNEPTESSNNPVKSGGVYTALSGKVDVESGKGLSANDFTDTLKSKLDGIASGAEVNVQSDWAQTNNAADDFIKNKPTLGSAAAKNATDTYNATGTDVTTGKAVAAALATLPKPMVFKGSLGTGGTITTLPTASSSNKGYVYKVITAGTYASQSAKVGDTFISDGSAWVLIPSGDEPSGTVTNVAIANGGGLTVSGSPVTSSGTITVGHSNSVTAKTSSSVKKFTYDAYGHVTDSSELSAAESNALASGIDSTKVAQIETNKNNISSVQEQANWNSNYGVKNICPYNSGTTSTGEGTVWNNLPIDIAAGTYSVSFSTDSANSALVLLAADGATEVFRKTYSTTTVNDTFTISTAAKYIRLYIGAPKTVSKFMIHSFGDDTYQPYAMSNVELTAAIQALQAQLANQ